MTDLVCRATATHNFFRQVLSDPMAKEEDLRKCMTHAPSDVLHHVNCPSSLFFELARNYPIDAVMSPMLAIHVLAMPDGFERLERENASNWVNAWLSQLPLREQETFAIRCIWHVMPLRDQLTGSRDIMLRQHLLLRWRVNRVATPDLRQRWDKIISKDKKLNYLPCSPYGIDFVKEAVYQSSPTVVLTECQAAAANFIKENGDADNQWHEEARWQWLQLRPLLVNIFTLIRKGSMK
jgi:hypothetical protein